MQYTNVYRLCICSYRYPQGKKPQCIQAIPKDKRKHACFSVMEAVAKLHHIREGPVENSDYQTATFWDNEVRTYIYSAQNSVVFFLCRPYTFVVLRK